MSILCLGNFPGKFIVSFLVLIFVLVMAWLCFKCEMFPYLYFLEVGLFLGAFMWGGAILGGEDF